MDSFFRRISPLIFLAALQCAAPARQAAAAEGAPTVPAPDKLGFTWMRIAGGEFSMGANEGEGDQKPAHPVKIKDFVLAKTEVTQAQWRLVFGANHASFKDCDACPVTDVSWDDAQEFIGKAGGLLGERLRLPTEAEWEYAAGGGAAHQGFAGTNNFQDVGQYVWFRSNSGRVIHPVCEKLPNLFGLCDMSGNVFEWCSDVYERFYYESSPSENPVGPPEGENRVLRGGCFNSLLGVVTVTQRYNSWQGAKTPYYGFRCAKDGR